ncbi:DUF2637 domain-containing protein [Streptomyces radicis]|uniref:DUF2637 domain-containing protein n=1 Tax=Streptomyces radicis TaxID=1750517 RepID=A0A3A9W2F3_9ACTN|nr:DUF2637 domain-containing protein [Streptomyces radicis]RKN07328.1 DUF2637 domain-containing protein [Streptomyces radicis]RKN26856.1 DUF2637 domain-containing protein [Streptomyces radicis]
MDERTLRQVDRTLSAGTWLIVAGAVVFSVLTVTPLVRGVTPAGWEWTAPILPVVVDAAVVIVVRLDAALARVGGRAGGWPVLLRWMTGLMTLGLNTAGSALTGDMVGVAVHAVAPLLLIVSSEASLAYRRALADALTAREAREQAARAAREQAAREREQRERADREALADREERRERERREHEARLAREEREHAAALAREQRETAREQERLRLEHADREREREHRAREQAEQARAQAAREREAEQARERARKEAAARAARDQAARRRAALLTAEPATEKQPEPTARETVAAAYEADLTIRQAAELCGWSVGWVTARYAEHRQQEVRV